MKKIILYLFILFFITAVLYLAYYFLFAQKGTIALPATDTTPKENPIINQKIIDFRKINPEFLFFAKIPNEFKAEYALNLRAINVYNPSISGESNIEKSQIYITLFKADRFLTLNTVDITQQYAISVNGKEAILYEIAKKETAPNFTGQPLWRNFKHKAIDIRYSKDSPSYFYSFAQNPNFSQKIFDDFINSLVFLTT